MLERRKPLDLLFPLKGGAESNVDAKSSPTPLDRLRAGVMLARDAVKAFDTAVTLWQVALIVSRLTGLKGTSHAQGRVGR